MPKRLARLAKNELWTSSFTLCSLAQVQNDSVGQYGSITGDFSTVCMTQFFFYCAIIPLNGDFYMLWKLLFIIYAIIFTALSVFDFDTSLLPQKISTLEAFVSTSVEVVLIFGLIYSFSLGWGKKLITERLNKIFFKISLPIFALVAVFLYSSTYEPMFNDMLLHAMHEGMVPRNWDFQMLLAMTRIEVLLFVLLMIFIIFAPFYFGFYHYSKQINHLSIAKNSGRKCFATYAIFSYATIFLVIFCGMSGDILKYNLFDCLSILSGLYIATGLLGYAFELEFLNPTFWRVTLPLCIFVEILPGSFFSLEFQKVSGILLMQSSPIYVISSYLLTTIAIVMIYRYACTDVVFKSKEG